MWDEDYIRQGSHPSRTKKVYLTESGKEYAKELMEKYGISDWNVIMGLSLSGSESISKGVILFNVKDVSILNGAEYGMEASVITTAVLGMLLFAMVKRWKGRFDKSGI